MLIETEEQARFLARARADRMQTGYMIYRHRYLPNVYTVAPRHKRVAKTVWQFIIGISPTKKS